jgi:hypothetical protein
VLRAEYIRSAAALLFTLSVGVLFVMGLDTLDQTFLEWLVWSVISGVFMATIIATTVRIERRQNRATGTNRGIIVHQDVSLTVGGLKYRRVTTETPTALPTPQEED